METDSEAGAPRRRFVRQALRRGATPVAIVAVAALLAGCGTASSGGGSSTSTGTSTTSTNAFNPNLVPAGGSSPGSPPKAPKPKTGKRPGPKSGPAKHSSTGTHTSGGGGGIASPGTGSGGGGAVTQTVTVTHTNTVTHTVTKIKYVRPNVPSGAGLPSRAAPVSVSQFDAAGGNIGCRISNSTVRCDVGHRVWSPPRRPSSCHAAWGMGLIVGSSGRASFVCARNSVLNPTGTYIHPGYDVKVGSVTCQVRFFGVTCFESDGHGFFIGRTGYTRF